MLYFFLFCLIAPVFGSHEENFEPESPEARFLGLSAGATRVVPNLRTTFTCVGRSYGYFADVDNNCQVFHVCQPSTNANGEPVIYHFSKFCPQETRFDQQLLTCLPLDHPKLLSCAESRRFFPLTETRLAEVPVVQQFLESHEQIPLEVARHETYAVKSPVTESRNVINNNIPTKNIVRSEPLPQQLPQQIPQTFVNQRAEQLVQPLPQTVPLQSVVSQPIVRNVEPIAQNVATEPVVPLQQRAPVKQSVIPQQIPSSVVGRNLVGPVAFRNTQSIPQQIVNQPFVSTPVQITRPVLLESDIHLRRTVPQTQIVEPIQVVQPLSHLYSYQSMYVPVVPQVIRPSQQTAPLARNTITTQQQVIPQTQLNLNQRSVIPQYLRVNEQPFVRQSQIPNFA